MPAKKAATKKTTKIASVEELEKLVNKKWGPRTLIRASDESLKIVRIPTGILSLDLRLGGGLARGRHTEIYGNYGVGKNMTAYRVIAMAQSLGMECALLNVEGSFEPEFAEINGVNLDKLVMPPKLESGNFTFDMMDTMIRSELFGVIVLDSISSLVPKEELEEDMSQGGFGTYQAKLMSKALRKLTAAFNSVERKPVVIYLNQTRQAIGVVFGKQSITSGGKSMGFYAGTRIELTRTETMKKKGKEVNKQTGEITSKEVVAGHRVLVNVEKDNTGGTHTSSKTTFVMDYATGRVDDIEDILYCGILTGKIKKKGSMFCITGCEDETVKGRANFKRYLREQGEEFLEDFASTILHADVDIESLEEVIENDEELPDALE